MKTEVTSKKTPSNSLASKVKEYTRGFKSKENEIIKKYASDIAKLEKARDRDLKKLRKESAKLIKALSPLLDGGQIKTMKTEEAAKEKVAKTKKKKSAGNRKPITDAEITTIVKDTIKDGSEMKTDDLLSKIGVGYPRFHKYAKGNESVIEFKGSKKKGGWVLKA